MNMPDLSALGDLAKQMEDAYSEGLGATDKVNKEIAKDMKADHEIEIDIKLSANVEGHDYKVDANILFEIELGTILQAGGAPMGDLSKALDGLDVDLGDDKGAVMEQLGQPRAVGVVKKIKVNELEVSNEKGKVEAELDKGANILATLKDGKLQLNFEGVFSYPEHTDVFVAIPSMEQMQKNIVVDVKKFGKAVKFNWTEKDKDNLKVSGEATVRKIK